MEQHCSAQSPAQSLSASVCLFCLLWHAGITNRPQIARLEEIHERDVEALHSRFRQQQALALAMHSTGTASPKAAAAAALAYETEQHTLRVRFCAEIAYWCVVGRQITPACVCVDGALVCTYLVSRNSRL